MTEDEKTIALMAAILYAGGVRTAGGILTDEMHCASLARTLVRGVELTRPKSENVPLAAPRGG